MTENNSTSKEAARKPNRLTWWLLLSVILIYGFSALRNAAVLVYDVYKLYAISFSDGADGYVLFTGGLIEALFFIFLLTAWSIERSNQNHQPGAKLFLFVHLWFYVNHRFARPRNESRF